MNLFWEGHLNEGNTAFILPEPAVLQVLQFLWQKAFGARVITSVLSDEIAEKIVSLGADVVINSAKHEVSEVLKQEELNGTPVNMSMDCLWGKPLAKACLIWQKADIEVISTLAGTEQRLC